MKKNLSFLQSSFSLRTRLKSLLAVAVLTTSISLTYAQNSVTLPDASVTTGSFLGPYVNGNRIYQLIIDDSMLTSLNGKYLTSIAFRLPNSATAAWPDGDATFSNYEISLSDGVDPANRQTTFVNNIVGPQTVVRTGPLVIPAGSLTTASSADPFSFEITFDTPYLYTGTNLIIEIQHSTANYSTSVAAAGTSSAGYGSLFSACWASSYNVNVSNGNFAAVKINSQDHLGVKSVEMDWENVIYPNPVNDVLNIKSTKEIKELHIFNMVGQKVYSEKNREKNSSVRTSNLPKGMYILQTIDQQGNTKSSKFIKD